VHNQYPTINHYDTERTGCVCIDDQQQDDMHNIIDCTATGVVR
jgi:glucosylceramidase